MTKYTNEVCDEIRELVAAGVHRQSIADLLGTTIGSLQVSCCKRGISLRRPKGTHMRQPHPRAVPDHIKNALPKVVLRKRAEEKAKATFTVSGVNFKLKVPIEMEALALLTMRAEKLGVTVDVVAQRLLEVVARNNLYHAIIDKAA